MPISSSTKTYSPIARAIGVASVSNSTLTPTLRVATDTTFTPVGSAKDSTSSGEDYSSGYIFRSYVVYKIKFLGSETSLQSISAANLNLTYETRLVDYRDGTTLGTDSMPVKGNTGTRTLAVHKAANTFTAATLGSDSWGVEYMTVASNPDRAWAGAMLEYDAGTSVTTTLSGTIADGTAISVDIMPIIRMIAPTYIQTPLGMGLNTSTAAEQTFCLMLKMQTESLSLPSSNCANFTTATPIVMTYTVNDPPEKPLLIAPADNATLTTDEQVEFSAEFDDQTGDAPTKFDLKISEQENFGSPVVDIQVNDSDDPLVTTVPLSTFKPNANYYWKIRAYDLAGATGEWSSIRNFLTPSVTGWSPSAANPTQTTSPRNKYRLEFYPMLESLNGFDPNPSAIIFDAKAIGIAHTVNAPGEFFFTLESDHLQVGKINPQKTMWRASRWDERQNYYRVIGEGIVTNSVITPHEVVFYGTDKIGMLNRIVVSADRIASGNSHSGTIGSIHSEITRQSIGGVTNAPAGVVTLDTVQFSPASNPFDVGDSIKITNIISGTQPVTGSYSKVVTSRTSTWFKVASFMPTNKITAAVRNSPATGQATYTTETAHGMATGMKATVVDIKGESTYNFSNLSVTVLNDTQFWVTLSPSSGTPTFANPAVVYLEVASANADLLKRITDMGWGESPSTLFNSYTTTNSGYDTATKSKQVQIAGNRAAEALAAVADILMAGTTSKVILENPNVGQPATKIDEMEVGLRYRHLKITDVVKPSWWFQYGVNIKNFTIEDNLDKIATKAVVINRNLDQSTESLYNNGTVDVDLYNEYSLIEAIEIINEERNDIEFSAQLQYMMHPDRLFTITTDVIPNTISPFANYAVGDDITVYIVHNKADIKKDLTIVGQRWVGNSNGAEYLMLSFAPRITKSFMLPKRKRVRTSTSTRGGDGYIPDDSRGGSDNEDGLGRGGGGGGDWSGGDNPIDPGDPGEPTDPGDVWYDGPWT